MKFYSILSIVTTIVVCAGAAVGAHALTSRSKTSEATRETSIETGVSRKSASELESKWKELLTQSSSRKKLSDAETTIWAGLYRELNRKRLEFEPELNPLQAPPFERETFQELFNNDLRNAQAELTRMVAENQQAGNKGMIAARLDAKAKSLAAELANLEELTANTPTLGSIIEEKNKGLALRQAHQSHLDFVKQINLTKTAVPGLSVTKEPLRIESVGIQLGSQISKPNFSDLEVQIQNEINERWERAKFNYAAQSVRSSATTAEGKRRNPTAQEVKIYGSSFERNNPSAKAALRKEVESSFPAFSNRDAWSRIPTGAINSVTLQQANSYCQQLNNDPKYSRYLQSTKLGYRLIHPSEWAQISDQISDQRIPTLLSNGSGSSAPISTAPDGRPLRYLRIALAPLD